MGDFVIGLYWVRVWYFFILLELFEIKILLFLFKIKIFCKLLRLLIKDFKEVYSKVWVDLYFGVDFWFVNNIFVWLLIFGKLAIVKIFLCWFNI